MIKGFSEEIKIPNVTPGHHTDLVNIVFVSYKELISSSVLTSDEMYPSRPKIVKNRKFFLLATYLLVLNTHLGISI